MPDRIEIRDGKEFTVTVIPRGQRLRAEGTNPRAIKANPRAKKNLICGGCGFVGEPGKRWRIRGQWVRCPSCVSLYAQVKKEQRDSAQLQSGDAVRVGQGAVSLGWNGVPSERSLRKRSR